MKGCVWDKGVGFGGVGCRRGGGGGGRGGGGGC